MECLSTELPLRAPDNLQAPPGASNTNVTSNEHCDRFPTRAGGVTPRPRMNWGDIRSYVPKNKIQYVYASHYFVAFVVDADNSVLNTVRSI